MLCDLDHNVIISIHALREEGDCRRPMKKNKTLAISIHALREEGDDWYCARPDRQAISIHALREEGDICSLGYDQLAQIFLSTPSARRATPAHLLGLSAPVHFYPRPPRGGRQHRHLWRYRRLSISIHALREEGDAGMAV